jgi:hypothetical protein
MYVHEVLRYNNMEKKNQQKTNDQKICFAMVCEYNNKKQKTKTRENKKSAKILHSRNSSKF